MNPLRRFYTDKNHLIMVHLYALISSEQRYTISVRATQSQAENLIF
jgi:hypothetical protein